MGRRGSVLKTFRLLLGVLGLLTCLAVFLFYSESFLGRGVNIVNIYRDTETYIRSFSAIKPASDDSAHYVNSSNVDDTTSSRDYDITSSRQDDLTSPNDHDSTLSNNANLTSPQKINQFTTSPTSRQPSFDQFSSFPPSTYLSGGREMAELVKSTTPKINTKQINGDHNKAELVKITAETTTTQMNVDHDRTKITETTTRKRATIAPTMQPRDNFTIYSEGKNSKKCHPLPQKFGLNDSLIPCDFRNRPPLPCSYRLRGELSCTNESVGIVYKWVNLYSPQVTHEYEDPCLARVIKVKCTKKGVTPKVVHYVNFKRREMQFHGFLSVLSAMRFIQPCLVLFHADYLPYGKYWEALVQLVPNLVHVNRTQPTTIFGRSIKVVQHSSDVARLQAILKFGGIYSDLDHLVLNPLDSLLRHQAVMGIESEEKNFGNGFFMGQPGALFLRLWYDAYRTFNDAQWGEHSCIVPFKLYKTHPDVKLHVVDSFFRPNGMHVPFEFYEAHYNWTELYGVHLYQRVYKKYFQGRIEEAESSLGEVTRRILFGDREACRGDKKVVDSLIPRVT